MRMRGRERARSQSHLPFSRVSEDENESIFFIFFAVTSPRTYNPQHENWAWREGAAPVTAGATLEPSVDLESISRQVQRCFLKILVFRFPGERK